MYRLLIVDDEPIIADGLQNLFIDLSIPDLEIYKNYYAEEALELMKRTRIDILLCDINMPDMTGLELQTKVNSFWPCCKVIFLTGYSDFDMIHTAIRNGAVDYVTKTEGEAAIISSVHKAITLLENDIRNMSNPQNVQTKIDHDAPLLRNEYLLDLLEGRTLIEDINPLCFEELHMSLRPDSPVFILLCRMDKWHLKNNHVEMMNIIYGIQDIAGSFLYTHVLMAPVIYDKSRIAWLLQPTSAKPDDFEWHQTSLFVNEMIENLQHACEESLNISISFIFTESPVDWEHLQERFYQLKNVFNSASGIRPGALLLQSDCADNNQTCEQKQETQEYLIRSELKKLDTMKILLESGQRTEFMTQLENFAAVFRKTRSISFDMLREVYYSIALMFLSHINQTNISNFIGEKFDLDKLTLLEKHASWDEVNQYFIQLTDCIFSYYEAESAYGDNSILINIQKYIDDNISGDVSVTRLAEVLHFNPSYLSRIFKNLTNTTLSEYIWKLKIEKAREMLNHSNNKIQNISSYLGFENPSYFARFFKKHTNLTPQEYRELLNLSNNK